MRVAKPEGCQAEQYVGLASRDVASMKPGLVRNGFITVTEIYGGVAVCGERTVQISDNNHGKVESALGVMTAAMCLDCPRNTANTLAPTTG